jgi:hypothetical protein
LQKSRPTHSTEINGKRYIWFTERLWKLAQGLPEFDLEVESLQELDRDCWFGAGSTPTIRAVATHCKRINEVDSKFPIIINANGRLMDGGHRLARAWLAGHKTIKAVQFVEMPEPDQIKDL